MFGQLINLVVLSVDGYKSFSSVSTLIGYCKFLHSIHGAALPVEAPGLDVHLGEAGGDHQDDVVKDADDSDGCDLPGMVNTKF